MSGKWFQRLFGVSKAHCDGLPLEDQLEDQLSIEEEEILEDRGSYVPSYHHLIQPVKTLTSPMPGQDVEGFRFAVGTPLSNNFLTQNVINLTSKKAPSTGNQMFDLFADKTPFYNMALQYHHGNLLSRRPHIAFSLVGGLDSNGRVNAMFIKNFTNFKLRLQSSFASSNVAMSQSNCEIEHAAPNTKQTLTLSSQILDYSLVERLGRSFLLGFDLAYLVQQNAWINGIALRYAARQNEKFYLQYSGMSRSVTLGALFKLNEATTMVTELEYGGPGTSDAAIGYRTKSKNYMVDSLVRTNGDLRSVFTYSQNEVFKLKLFLSGNLGKEEFKSGFCVAIGSTDE